MKSISWMTFIFVVAFAIYLRSYESFSSAGRDQISQLEARRIGVERSLSSVEENNLNELKELGAALNPKGSAAPAIQ